MVMVFGEITTKAEADYEKIVRDTCRGIGFVYDDVGLDADHCKVLVNTEQQSPDIAQGVHGHFTKHPEEIGAGDQGHMFGYATDETPELMPLSHVLATKLGARLTEVRKNGTCPWLRPDGKTQVTVVYRNEQGAMVPVRVHTVLISTQHDETVTNDEIAADLKEHVIKPVIPEQYLDEKTIFHLNPSTPQCCTRICLICKIHQACHPLNPSVLYTYLSPNQHSSKDRLIIRMYRSVLSRDRLQGKAMWSPPPPLPSHKITKMVM